MRPRAPLKEEIKDPETVHHTVGELHYKKGDKIATRLVFGNVLKKLGDKDKRIIGLDGDVKNSTFSIKLKESHPD
jgi:transketolase